jgi:hypothetical protein
VNQHLFGNNNKYKERAPGWLAPIEEIDLLVVDVLETTINRKIESIYWQLEFLV